MSKVRKPCLGAVQGKCWTDSQKGIYRVHSKVKKDPVPERKAKYRCQTCGTYSI